MSTSIKSRPRERDRHIRAWSYPRAHRPPESRGDTRPIVVGIDESARGQITAQASIAWASRLRAPLVFVFVRRAAPSMLGEPYLGRHLQRETLAARAALQPALTAAGEAGVVASAAVVEGEPARRLLEFARLRDASLLMVGHRRRRWGRSLARKLLHRADRPVLAVPT